MNIIITKKLFWIFFCLTFSGNFISSNCTRGKIRTQRTIKKRVSQIKTIYSINEVKELLEQISPSALVIFDIGETLAIQKNNLLRIIRNYRIFNQKDIHSMNVILSKFMKRDPNAKATILSNMLIHSPLYFVEQEVKTIIQNLQQKQIKIIAHCSSKAKPLGVIENYKDWRFTALQKLGIDFSSSFEQKDLSFVELIDQEGFFPIFYKGLLFGGNPKGKALLAFLDEVKFIPSEVIYFDDCEKFVKSYARELKKRNINFKGFIYKAALNPPPLLDTKIVDIQVKFMKQKKFFDDLKAIKIINRNRK